MFHRWLVAQRQLVPPGSATIKAIDYSLKRWGELTHFVDDGDVPISNNWVENHIRPIALRRSNWLFAGSLGRLQVPPKSCSPAMDHRHRALRCMTSVANATPSRSRPLVGLA